MATPGPSAEPGQTTTEFWVTLVVSALALLAGFNVVHVTDAQQQAVVGFTAAAVTAASYILSRGIRKAGTGQ